MSVVTFPLCAKIKAFPHFTKRIDKNREKDDGCSRRYLQLIGQQKTTDTSDIGKKDGQENDSLETSRKKIRCQLGDGKQGHGQYNTNHP